MKKSKAGFLNLFSPIAGSADSLRNPRGGSALIMVMMMILLGGIYLGTLYTESRQRVFSLERDSNRIKALSIAEAGLGHAFSHIAGDVSRASDGNVIINNNFSGGSYEVNASTPDGAAEGVVLLTSVGNYRDQVMESMATILVQTETVTDSTESPTTPIGPFGPVALLAGLDLTFSGGVMVNLQDLGAHANGSVVLSGGPNLWAGYLSTNGSLTLNGNPQIYLDGGEGRMHADGPISLKGTVSVSQITSSISIEGTWGVNTSATHIAPEVNYPQWFNNPPPSSLESVSVVMPMSLPPLDVEAFLTYAQQHGSYYEGRQQINRSWLTKEIKDKTGVNVHNNETLVVPAGGVMFVEGDVHLNSDMDFEGVLIATGSVTVGGAATFSNPTGYPAIVSVDGNISVGGGSAGLSVDGWIYAMNGSVTASGGASGMTGIIAAQNIDIRGGYTIGSAGTPNAVTWPGADDGEGGEESPSAGSVHLLSWIR